MAEPKVLVVRAAGTNCERETVHGFEMAGAATTLVHINRLLENKNLLSEHGLLALPGGFSYGDHVNAGKIWALELTEALGEALDRFVGRGGLILGICNGFQVLVKTGLLPGAARDGTPRQATLAWNDSHHYEDRWVHLAVDAGRCVFAPKNKARLSLPVGHAEGRFTVTDKTQIDSLIREHQAVFRYIDEDGKSPGYPGNPNGSMGDIAGVCDLTGQILGLMPHPDRALFPYNHPRWTREPERQEGDGVSLFRAAVEAMR